MTHFLNYVTIQRILTQMTQEYTLNPVQSNHRDGPMGHNNSNYYTTLTDIIINLGRAHDIYPF